MKSFIAFFKKELLESIRSGKFIILAILFCAFGIMNPAIAKLTPWLIEVMSEEMAESGMIITEIKVDALTSWTQFFKNIPIALITLVFMYAGSFAKEYESEALILILTKGLERCKVILAKTSLLILIWSLGYWLCFGITYGYNVYFWDNSIAMGLMPATINWWIFGIFTVILTVFFSIAFKSYSSVLIGTGSTVLLSYILGAFPKIFDYTPTKLIDTSKLLIGSISIDEYAPSLVVTITVTVVLFAISIPMFNRKQI